MTVDIHSPGPSARMASLPLTTEPPRWELAGTRTYEADPVPAVRERYRERRDLTAAQAGRDNVAASTDTIAADRVAGPAEGVART